MRGGDCHLIASARLSRLTGTPISNQTLSSRPNIKLAYCLSIHISLYLWLILLVTSIMLGRLPKIMTIREECWFQVL